MQRTNCFSVWARGIPRGLKPRSPRVPGVAAGLRFIAAAGVLLALVTAGLAQSSSPSPSASGGSGSSQPSSTSPSVAPGVGAGAAVAAVSPQYILRQGDVVQVRVYQEDDLTSNSRIGKDGTVNLPLLGAVKVMGNTIEEASKTIQDLLAADYLVNPQVSLNIAEFAKRRFTVLGQVQKPGTYDMPSDESVSLLQAIATAGGYTRIGNPRRITVQRTVDSENKLIKLDAEAMAQDKKEKPFVIQPDDVIIVGEKWI